MFAPNLVAKLPGPDWLVRSRASAAERVAAESMPTADAEEWRYSPIEDLVPDRFILALSAPPMDSLDPPLVDSFSARICTADGFIVSLEVPDNRVDVLRLTEATEAVEMGVGHDVFADANCAFAPEPLLIRIPPRTTIADPVLIEHRAVYDSAAFFPRVRVEVGADSEVEIVETYSSADIDSLSVPVTEIVVGDASRVRYQQIQNLGRRMWQLASLDVGVGRDATFAGGIAAIGSAYARLRSDCRLEGRGSTGNLDAIYFGTGDQVLDFRVFHEHMGRDTNSELAFKGVVDDSATSIFTGLIRVGPEAAGTNAHQANRAIKLSDEAWAESVPNLEIENNEVRCSHASTVSPVDAEQLFYLESRGVPGAVAERLIVEGFLREAVASMPVEPTRPWLTELIELGLDRKGSR